MFHFLFEINRVSPLITFGAYLQMFGGIRVGELMNLKKSSIKPIGLYGIDGMVIKIVDKEQREDLKDSIFYDGVKVKREQAILPIKGLIDSLYRNHMENIALKSSSSALFVNHSGDDMTSDMYRYHFSKAKESFIKKLVYHEKQKVRDAGLLLRSEKWTNHFFRGKFTHMVADNAENLFDTMRLRGDKSIDSAIVYLSNSPKTRKKISQIYSKLFRNALQSDL